MNVFRRFTVDRAKVLEFYGDVLGLKALPPIGMAGGNQMSRFQVGTSEIKLTGSTPGRQDQSGAVRETTGLRVFTFFFPDEAALTARFVSHGLPAPAFKAREGGTRGAMVLDPDSQWVELVVAAGAPPETFSRLEVGLTVSDLEKSRAFYREFVGLEELPPVESAMLGVPKYPFRHGTMTVNVWSFGKGLPANTYTAGIQYVISDVEVVDAKAKAGGVTITTPLGKFGTGLRTIWLGDPDGITNYFAQLMRNTQAAPAQP
jgi:predicted enzyme related to lactoylglutathione lyase